MPVVCFVTAALLDSRALHSDASDSQLAWSPFCGLANVSAPKIILARLSCYAYLHSLDVMLPLRVPLLFVYSFEHIREQTPT